MGNYFITFGANMCWGRAHGLEDTTLTAEAKYSINFSRSQRKFCLNLHYNRSNSFLFVTVTKIYQFKGNDSGIKKYTLCLGNISKDLTFINMKKQDWIDMSTNFLLIIILFTDTSNIADIHKYLMKKRMIQNNASNYF